MNGGHKGGGDHPVELVEQLQIRLTLENKTLDGKVAFIQVPSKIALFWQYSMSSGLRLDICCCFS